MTFYIISASTNGGIFRTVANVRGTDRIAYGPLPAPGVTTVYRIHAVTSGAGNGASSAGVSIDMPATTPSDPSGLSSQIRVGEGIFLRWSAPSSDGGSPITGYRVEVRTGSGWSVLDETTETSFLAPLAAAGVNVEHRVIALNAAGASPGARSLFTRMGIAPATAPLSTKAQIQSGRVVVSWLAPAVMGGQFSRYEIQAFDNGSFRSIGTSRTLEIALSLHAPGTTRVFRVAAVTDAGTGAWSANIEVVSPKVVPSTPIWTSVGSVGRTNTVSWRTTGINNGGGQLDQAILFRDESGSWVEVARADVSAGTLSFANTTFGISHRYILRFTNEMGLSPSSTIITMRHAVVATGPVTGLTAAPEGNGLRLSWASPEFIGGSAPRSIEIQSSVDGSSWIRVGQFNYANSALVGLPAKGATISYRVITRNLAGTSEPSSAVSYTTPRTLPGTDFSVSPTRSGNQVLFRVTSPGDFGGFSELSVRIERQGALAWQSSEEFKLTRPRSTFTFGLELPTIRGTYVYRVAIVNPLGEVERTVTFRY